VFAGVPGRQTGAGTSTCTSAHRAVQLDVTDATSIATARDSSKRRGPAGLTFGQTTRNCRGGSVETVPLTIGAAVETKVFGAIGVTQAFSRSCSCGPV